MIKKTSAVPVLVIELCNSLMILEESKWPYCISHLTPILQRLTSSLFHYIFCRCLTDIEIKKEAAVD